MYHNIVQCMGTFSGKLNEMGMIQRVNCNLSSRHFTSIRTIQVHTYIFPRVLQCLVRSNSGLFLAFVRLEKAELRKREARIGYIY